MLLLSPAPLRAQDPVGDLPTASEPGSPVRRSVGRAEVLPKPPKSEATKVHESLGDQPVRRALPFTVDPPPVKLEKVEFDTVPLADAMRVFATETGMNVICSTQAGQTIITVYLRDVEPIAALEAIVKANGLFYRVDESSGIYRIATAEEYEKDLTSFREEQTRVFTLLYPNPTAVAQVIAQVFGSRVDLNMADADQEDLMDLSQRFNRFDLVDGRALGLGTFDGGKTGGMPSSLLPGMGAGQMPLPLGMGGLPNRFGGLGADARTQRDGDLSAAEIQTIEDQLAAAGTTDPRDRDRLLQRGKATIYVSTIRRNNQIVVRTADEHSMAEIEQLVQQLDVPTPTVLLEVKVLRIHLADGVSSAFEYFAGAGVADTAFSDGSLVSNFPGGNGSSRPAASGLGLSGSIPGSLTFQMVDSEFQFRMQALESKSRVTALATPLILTANNEVSRIFVGDTLPFTVGFTPSQVVGGLNAVTGALAATPITELRDVGQSLLITPNINADRTVTLRVVEENSERILGGASIPVPDSSGAAVTSVQVDTVRRRNVSGTVIAQDGMAVALGGLIEETVSDNRDQIPVLGDIPGIGFLFQRRGSLRARTELVVVIRPYVFNTPGETAATCQTVLEDMSVHPNSPDVTGTMNCYPACNVVRPDPECRERAKLFRFHNVKDSG